MTEARDIVTRTRRFAHMIVSCADEADQAVFDALNAERVSLASNPADYRLQARIYRSLCDRLINTDPGTVAVDQDKATQPVIVKFRKLPIVNRLAFALLVIEEFSSDTAASILRLPDNTLEEKIQQSRLMLFEEQGPGT